MLHFNAQLDFFSMFPLSQAVRSLAFQDADVTYVAVVDESVFPGNAVSFLRSAVDLDCPRVGVDLSSIGPLQRHFQEDKNCP